VGSGVRRIFREAEELGLPEPQFIEIGMRLRVVVYLAKISILFTSVGTVNNWCRLLIFTAIRRTS